jgi:hypothetical protein
MDIQYLKDNRLLILEALSGSKAYGLDTPESDDDFKGVFMLSREQFYGLQYIPQINMDDNNAMFYEWRRFVELLSVNNPNILELLETPADALIFKHPLLEKIDSSRIISKLCKDTFGRFALSQVKKARGLNKKIVNPLERERKTVLDFCYVAWQGGSTPLKRFLGQTNMLQEHCGLVNIPNMHNLYGLYYGENSGYKGIIQKSNSDDISLSSIPKGEPQISLLYFNKDGFSTYCREYREYWEWVEKRNETRYQNTLHHGKNYDAKNMMHTFRLLEMAIEIAKYKKVIVRRPDAEFLLRIKKGEFEYEQLIEMAAAKYNEMEAAFEVADLPDAPDLDYLNELAYEIRAEFYKGIADKTWPAEV